MIQFIKSASLIAAGLMATTAMSSGLFGQNRTDNAPRVAMLIGKLGADRSIERHQAMDELIESGAAAVEKLMVAIPKGDLDFRIRAIKTIQSIGMRENENDSAVAERALLKLSSDSSDRIANMADKCVTQLFAKKETQALKVLEQKGVWIREDNEKIGTKYYYPLKTLVFDKKWKGNSKDLTWIRYLRNHQSIEFVGKQFSDSVVDLLPSHCNAVSIAFKDAPVTDRVFDKLKKLKKLSRIIVQYSDKVSTAATQDLQEISALTEIKLVGTRISTDDKADLEKQLPGVTVDVRKGGFLGIRYNNSATICRISTVVAGSGAEKGGIKVGDIIVEYDGTKITSTDSLSKVISKQSIGQQVEVKVKRGEKTVDLKVTLTRWQ